VLSLSRVLSVVSLAALIGGPLGLAPALAQSTAPISGNVTDPGGAAVAGATVSLHGPSLATTTTDANGHFSVNAVPGVYSVTVTKTGFLGATEDDIALAPGGVTISVRLQRPTFSSLQTIGSTRGSAGGGGGPQFNTTPASQQVIGQQVFENQGDLQIRDVLDETPGIVASIPAGSANGGVPGAITFPQIRGGLSYETAALIDGHPVSVGEYGDYVTTFLNRFLFQDVELEKGPGAITPLISRSVNGTVNFRTWDPTPTLTSNAEVGADAWGGKYYNLRIADTIANGKLGFVFDYTDWGTPGPAGNNDPQSYLPYTLLDDGNVTYTDSQGNPVKVSQPSEVGGGTVGAKNTYVGFAGNVLGCCVNLNTWFQSRGFLGKLRYNFSNSTSLTFSEISTQTLSSQNGNTNELYAYNYAPTVPGLLPPGSREAFNPYSDLFAGDYEINNEPIFEGELRTQIDGDNVLFRAYHAGISRLQTNGDPPDTPIVMPVYLYGQTTGGAPLNGLDPYGKPYVATYTDPLYQSNEIDSLTGYSFEYDHPLGESGDVLTFSTDQNYSQTHVYEPGVSDIAYGAGDIPSGSAQNTGTYLLRGTFQITPKLSAIAGYYLTRFSSNFATWYDTSTALFLPVFNDIVNWHSDERVALAYRADHDTSVRFAAGSAVVPAYLGILTGAAAGTPQPCGAAVTPPKVALCPDGQATGYTTTIGGGLNIQPETSFGYDLGADRRIGSDGSTVLSGDIYLTNLHDQFLKAYYSNGTFDGLPLYTEAYSNLSDSRYQGIELTLNHSPRVGFGYILQGSLIHDAPYDVPSGTLAQNEFLVAGENFGPETLASNTRMPYSQGYAEASYRSNGFYANVGGLYIGPNNSYNEPAFMVFASTVRVPLFHGPDNDVHGNTSVQLSVRNLFNVHPEIFDLDYQGLGYAGNNGANYLPSLKGYGPRSFILSLSHDFK
jgi:hypothetical protein